MEYEIVNGWLIYQECNFWVVDDKCGNKYYYTTHDEAVFVAENIMWRML